MTTVPQAGQDRAALLAAVRSALSELLGSGRRLRGRDQHREDRLSMAQVRALVALDKEDAVSAGRLARAADLNPASMTAMLDHLERDGIVERRRSSEDRRVCNVLLTDQGRALLEQKRARWTAIWEERLAGVDDDELASAARVMQVVAELFDEL